MNDGMVPLDSLGENSDIIVFKPIAGYVKMSDIGVDFEHQCQLDHCVRFKKQVLKVYLARHTLFCAVILEPQEVCFLICADDVFSFSQKKPLNFVAAKCRLVRVKSKNFSLCRFLLSFSR